MTRISAKELDALSDFARAKWGLVIDDKKRVIVENRIASLQRSVDVESVESLIRSLRENPDQKLELALFDVLSTNHTHFFRESEHLDLLRKEVLDPAKAGKNRGIRIWSAGCSRGCEPYSLSILMHEVFGNPLADDHRILATDLSTGALAAAKLGRYTGIELEGLSDVRRRRHFTEIREGSRTSFEIAPGLRPLISFGMLNLLDRWPMKGPFDAIFCRNVMIYFDAATRRSLAQRFLSLVRPGGLLIVGTSESLADFDLDVEPMGASAYRKGRLNG